MNLLTLVLVCMIVALSAGIVVMNNLLKKKNGVIDNMDKIIKKILKAENGDVCYDNHNDLFIKGFQKVMSKTYEPKKVLYNIQVLSDIKETTKEYNEISEYVFSPRAITMRRGDTEFIVILDDVSEIIIDKV